jgi:tetratricopeptide (TPR) repeat protein
LAKPNGQKEPPPISSLPTQAPQNSEDEKSRILRYNLDRAQKNFNEKKYEEAEIILNNILDHLAPNQPDAVLLLQKVDEARSLEEKEAKDETVEEDLKPKTKSHVKKLKLSKKEDQVRLKKDYKKGVNLYEDGQLSEAEELLSEVAQAKGNPNQTSAKNLIKEIQKKQKKQIKQETDEINQLMESGDPVLAYQKAHTLAERNPDLKVAIDLYRKVENDLEAKAKKAYMEGITFLEVVEDRASALERFEEALRLSPNPQSRYHTKATQKIRELKSSVKTP